MLSRTVLAAALALSVAVPFSSPAFAQVTADVGNDANEALKSLYSSEWEWRQQELAIGEGGTRGPGADRLAKVDAASQARRLAYWEKTLATLNTIDVSQLSPEEKINASVFRHSIESFIARGKAQDYQAPMAAGASFWARLAPRAGFRNAAEYRAYISRMRDIPRFFDEQTVNMRTGLARGFTAPQAAIVGREKTIEPFANPDAEANPFYGAFRQMPTSIPAAEQEALRAEGKAAIEQAVAPAYAKLLPFIRDEYIPGARKTLAAEQLPDGKTYYQARIREYVTYDWTAEEIHQIGLKEVARIRAEMEVVMRKAGWTGDFAGFLQFMKTDEQFVAKTPYELIAKTTYIINTVNGKIGQTIGLLPRFRFTILPTPAAIAPFGTGGNGGLDSCVFNTYNLPARKLYTLPALAVHECMPGHSFQAALAMEGPDRPDFRRSTYFSGYGEGWGLYTEWLGIGMGVYETPYEDFGRLTYEMWRAARLVIDTGVHHYGWSREKAIDYLASNTALADHEVGTEIDRYISEPGQALAYKIGEMLIRRKRAEAEAKLGAKFDQRWFHDVFLALGSVPLPVLEQELDAWIAAGGPNPNAEPDASAD